jgi:hypothetical protein
MFRIQTHGCSRQVFVLFVSILAQIHGMYLNGKDVVVGVVSTGDITEEILQQQWAPTFQTLLTEKVGQFLDPPRNFSLVLLDIPTAFERVGQRSVDFLYSTPSFFYCVQSENSGHHNLRAFVFFCCRQANIR